MGYPIFIWTGLLCQADDSPAMACVPKRVFLVVVILVVVLAGVGGEVLAATVLDPPTSPDHGSVTTAQSNGDINASLEQLARAGEGSQLASVLAGKQVNVEITQPDGSTVTKGITFDSSDDITVDQTGYANPALTTSLSAETLESIAASPDSSRALEKAIKYDLVDVTATGMSESVLTSLASQGTKLGARSRIASARIDIDDDPVTDAILEIEALDTTGDGEFDRLVRTVLRDIDNDGVMDTVTSETRPVAATVTGSVDLDLNNDGTRDTLLRLTGEDTNTDGELDERTKATLTDTRGDPQFDSFSETVEPIPPASSVKGEWDLNNDGTTNARLTIAGEDLDGDGSFDQQTLTIALNLDGEPGFESTSSTTAAINPTLSIAAEFDTDGDGTPDTKAELAASDGNDDGGLDSESVSVVNDSDGDGVYDTIVQRDDFRRGFLSNQGEPIQYLDDPGNLTVIGVLASILSMLLQLIQGG